MFDVLCDTPDKLQILSGKTGRPDGGNSMIYGPDGRELCEPLAEDKEGILYAHIDVGLIPFSKAAADPVGHYSRSDVMRLMLNRTKNIRVQSFELTAGQSVSMPAAEDSFPPTYAEPVTK